MAATTAPGDNVAPGDLEKLRRFINTVDLDPNGEETLTSPSALATWLRDEGFSDTLLKLERPDLERALEFREALRQALVANAGNAMSRDAVQCLNEQLEEATLTLRFQPDGSAALEPTCEGLDAVLSRMAAIVETSMREGTWARLKACAAEDCLWAFYDQSRNRSGTWCDMAVCGNRAKVKAYRERHGA
jgi:predicted RNA-binding Zn ribbon-like protein